jgi:hypothetical protein
MSSTGETTTLKTPSPSLAETSSSAARRRLLQEVAPGSAPAFHVAFPADLLVRLHSLDRRRVLLVN